MSRKLKYDIPGPDWRRTPEAFQRGGWVGLFTPELPAPAGLVVEIGFGRGEFLLDQAERYPEMAVLGIEISFKRVLKMARRVAVGPLRNLRLVHASGERVIGECLEKECVDAFWLNFPDPWPKQRHRKKRIVQPPFVHMLASRLVPGGTLYVATDDRAYAEQIDAVLSAETLLRNDYAPLYWKPEVEGRLQTAYEREWRAEGRSLHFFAYRRFEVAATDAAISRTP